MASLARGSTPAPAGGPRGVAPGSSPARATATARHRLGQARQVEERPRRAPDAPSRQPPLVRTAHPRRRAARRRSRTIASATPSASSASICTRLAAACADAASASTCRRDLTRTLTHCARRHVALEARWPNWSGKRARAPASSKGLDGGRRRGRGQHAPPRAAAHPDEGEEEGARSFSIRASAVGRQRQGPRHVHAPLRDDDRRRPARSCSASRSCRGRPTTSSSPPSCKDVKSSVEQGATFSDSLRRHPKVFDPLYTNLVQAGEVGGILDTILNRLAVYIEKAMKLKRQVRGAMVYPIVVSSSSSASCRSSSASSSRRSRTMFKDFGSPDDLPVLTAVRHRGLRGVHRTTSSSSSSWSRRGRRGSCGVYRTPEGKKFVHKLLLRVPDRRARLAEDRRRALHAHAAARCSRRASPSSTRSRSSPRPRATSSSRRPSSTRA